MYCAGVSRLYRNLLHPGHEAIAVAANQSTMYTPYLVAIAIVGKLVGLTPFAALQVAGVLNVLGMVASLCFLYSRVSMHRQWSLPAACGLVSMLLLHWFHIGWSSAFSLTNFQYIQAYPSTMGWSMAFLCFGLLEDLRKHRRLRDLGLLGFLISALLLNHLLTASWVVGIVGLFGIHVSISERSIAPLMWSLAAIAVAIVPLTLWPYASFFGQSSLMDVKENAPFGGLPWKEFPSLYGVGLVCFAFLFLRCYRHSFWFIAMLATLGALGLWNALGIGYGDRFALYATFFPHFVAGEVMALGIFAWLGLPTGMPQRSMAKEKTPWLRHVDRWVPIVVVASVCVSWLVAPLRIRAFESDDWGKLDSPLALHRRSPQHDDYYRRFEPLRPFLGTQDLVLTPATRAVFDLAGITGSSVVAAPNAHRVPDRFKRARQVHQFFHAKTSPQQRMALARRTEATRVLVPRSHLRLLPTLKRSFGEPLFRNRLWALFEVKKKE